MRTIISIAEKFLQIYLFIIQKTNKFVNFMKYKLEELRKLRIFVSISWNNCADGGTELEPILADLDRLWEMRHWIPNLGELIFS